VKIKKIITASVVIALIGLNGAYAASDNIRITRDEENVTVTASMTGIPANSNVGITAYRSDYNLMNLSGYTGVVSDFYLIRQAKTDSEGNVSATIPIDKIPGEGITVSFSALDSERLEADLKIHSLSISGTGNGSVTTDSPMEIIEGETVTLTYTPESGNRLAYLKINGETVVSNVSSPGVYTTAPLTSDMVVTYSFMSSDSIMIKDISLAPQYTKDEISCYLPVEEREKLNRKLSVVFAGTAYSKVENYTRVSAGILFSDNSEKLENSKNECTYVEADGISDNGNFIIMFTGDNSLYEKDFYAQSCAEYKNSETGDTITVYGEVTNFRLSPFSEKLYMTSILESLHLNPAGIKPHRLD